MALLLRMDCIDMHVQLISASKGLAAVFAVVLKSARKVDALHVVLRVHFLSVDFSTNGTLVLPPAFPIYNLDNILLKDIPV